MSSAGVSRTDRTEPFTQEEEDDGKEALPGGGRKRAGWVGPRHDQPQDANARDTYVGRVEPARGGVAGLPHLASPMRADPRPGGRSGAGDRTGETARRGERRQDWAERLADRLDGPMSVLGVLFLFVVLGQTLARDPALSTALAVAGWGLWLVFVAEFVLQLYVAPDRTRFLRRRWWQALFLVVPFLRFLRLVRLLRFLRVSGVVSSAVRGSRSAGRLLTGRLGWLLALTAAVVLACSQLVMVTGDYTDFGSALHDVAYATITGEPMSGGRGFVRVLEVVLACYSVVVFATLAATLGAFFLRRTAAAADAEDETGPTPT